MNPIEDLIRRMVAEGKSDAEIDAAVANVKRSSYPGGGYGKLADIGRLALQGATFNWGDEATAAVRALSPNVTYKDAQREEQQKVDDARRRAGGLGITAELAGGIVVPGIGAGKVAATGAKVAPRGAQLLKQAAVGAGAGAGAGVVAGSGAATPGNRLESGLVGGGLGALFGTFLSGAVAPGARQVRRYFGGATRTTADEKSAAALQEVLERQGVTNSDDATRAAASRLTRPGASGRRVMDTSREMQELSVDAARASRKAEKQLEGIAESRIANQNTDVVSDVRAAVGAKNIESAAQVEGTAKALKAFEDQEYAKLFSQYPDAITDKSFIRAWKTARKHLRPYIASLPKEQALKDEPLRKVLQSASIAKNPEIVRVDGMDIPLVGTGRTTVRLPTLEGVHRFKMTSGSVEAALRDKVASKSASGGDIRAYRALRAFNRRLKDILPDVPGGKEYARIQKVGQRGRAQQEAVEAGAAFWDKDATPHVMASDIAAAERASGAGKGVKNLRIGAVGRVAQDASAGEDVLARMSTEKAGQTVRALAPSQQRAAEFQRNMADRRMMAETNALQKGKATKQKEILKGARANSTALAFGEAGTIGALGTGGSVAGPLKLAVGALGAKALQGWRGKATALAAEDLAKLLVRGADDPAANLTFYDMAMALERLQRKRMAAQAGASAAGSSFLSTRTAR